jgi:RNA recognition motif-containing protein
MLGALAIKVRISAPKASFAVKPVSRKFSTAVDNSTNDRANVVYVKGLPADATWKLLKSHFETVGPVSHVRIASNSEGKAKVTLNFCSLTNSRATRKDSI